MQFVWYSITHLDCLHTDRKGVCPLDTFCHIRRYKWGLHFYNVYGIRRGLCFLSSQFHSTAFENCISQLLMSSFPSVSNSFMNREKSYMKSFIAKRVNSILVNWRELRFKLLKYKENNKKSCNIFDHNFKNIPLYIMRMVSLERYYFVLYNGALTLKMWKWS